MIMKNVNCQIISSSIDLWICLLLLSKPLNFAAIFGKYDFHKSVFSAKSGRCNNKKTPIYLRLTVQLVNCCNWIEKERTPFSLFDLFVGRSNFIEVHSDCDRCDENEHKTIYMNQNRAGEKKIHCNFLIFICLTPLDEWIGFVQSSLNIWIADCTKAFPNRSFHFRWNITLKK